MSDPAASLPEALPPSAAPAPAPASAPMSTPAAASTSAPILPAGSLLPLPMLPGMLPTSSPGQQLLSTPLQFPAGLPTIGAMPAMSPMNMGMAFPGMPQEWPMSMAGFPALSQSMGKRHLDEEDEDDDDRPRGSGAKTVAEMTPEELAKRRAQNRRWAQASRARKKQRLGELEHRVKELESSLAVMSRSMAELHGENQKLKTVLSIVSTQLQSQSGNGNGAPKVDVAQLMQRVGLNPHSLAQTPLSVPQALPVSQAAGVPGTGGDARRAPQRPWTATPALHPPARRRSTPASSRPQPRSVCSGAVGAGLSMGPLSMGGIPGMFGMPMPVPMSVPFDSGLLGGLPASSHGGVPGMGVPAMAGGLRMGDGPGGEDKDEKD